MGGTLLETVDVADVELFEVLGLFWGLGGAFTFLLGALFAALAVSVEGLLSADVLLMVDFWSG